MKSIGERLGRQKLRRFAERTRANGSSVGALLLAAGRDFEPGALPAGVVRGPIGECYENVKRLTRDNPDLMFAEGYAIGPDGKPVEHHAWAIDASGRVADPTFDGRAYLGIALPDQTWAGALSPLRALALDWKNGRI